MKTRKWSQTMRKVVAVGAAVALSAAVFTGCQEQAQTANEAGQTVIRVGDWPQKEGTTLDNWEARKTNYEEANPDVAIERDYWAWDLKSFYSKAAAGNLPTVYDTHFTEFNQIVDSGYAADLTDVMQKRGYDGKFSDKILDVVSKDGRVYAFPYQPYVLGLAYNTEMFEAAGLTEADGTPKQPKDWDEVVEFAKQIKAATGKPGFVFPTSGNNGGWLFTCLAWSFGVDFMEQDAEGNWKATFDTPEAAEALQYIKDLKWVHDVLPSNTLIDGEEYYKVFGTNGAGMMIAAGDYTYRLVQYETPLEQTGIMAIPAGPKRHVTLLGGHIYCVAPEATEEQIDASIRWAESAYNYNATDEFKQVTENNVKTKAETKELVGPYSMSAWANDTESVSYERQIIDKYANANPNHYRLYNEFVMDCPAELQAEEPICAQELYATLDSCIQEVLSDENADCAAILAKANADFQADYLDNLDF